MANLKHLLSLTVISVESVLCLHRSVSTTRTFAGYTSDSSNELSERTEYRVFREPPITMRWTIIYSNDEPTLPISTDHMKPRLECFWSPSQNHSYHPDAVASQLVSTRKNIHLSLNVA
jgi:hypothetical protein